MAKKKNQTKKHKFKYSAPVVPGAVALVVPERSEQVNTLVRPVAGGRDFSYVGGDLKKIAVLAASLVGFEVLMWFVFGHTAIGNSIYQLVQV